MNLFDLLNSLNSYISINNKIVIDEIKDKLVLRHQNGELDYLPLEFYRFKELIFELTKKEILLSDLTDSIISNSSFIEVPLFYSLLKYIENNGFAVYNIKKVMKIITKKGCEHRSINLNIEDYNISKFTYFYFKKYKLILENTINSVEIELYNLDFYNYFTNNKNKENLSNLDKNIIYLLQSLFFIDACKENNELNNWDFHDSLFHLKSRFGRHNNGYGATYRYKNNDDIPKIMKKINKNTNEILLEKPDKNKLRNKNLNFFDVLEKRFSSRKYSNMPIKINEISDFLFLTSRVKEIKEDYHCEITKRPYPNGGSLYELELYLTILNCRELKNGLYYYNPKKHSLIFINKININTEKMITFAQNASKCKNFHVLITITARFQRVMWKYESISYSLILKNTGVLLQNLSLAATSLNLGSCIIGAGDLDTLSNEIGEKFYNESAVGEIILGKI